MRSARLLGRPAALTIAVSLAALVGACSAVGPTFRPPSIPATSRYLPPEEETRRSSSSAAASPGQTLAVGETVAADWWSLFHSQDLDLLVREAISGSPTLKSAALRLAAAQEEVREAASALSPQVSLSASLAKEKQSASAFGLPPSAFALPPNYTIFQVGPSASYALDLFGGVRRRVEAQSALAERERYQLDAAYLSLTGNVVLEAVRIAVIGAELKAADEIIALDQQNLVLIRKESEAGAAPGSDVVIASSQLAADETSKPALEQALSQARHGLAVLLGRPPGEWAPPAFAFESLTLPGRLPLSVPSQLVRRRPDILAAEAQLHADCAAVGVATARLYPNVTLSAGASVSSLDGSPLFDPAGLVWSLAAGVAQPVFDGGLRRAERRAALDDFKASAADYQATVLQSFGQVADILTALAHDQDRIEAERRALDSAARSVSLQRINYTRGGAGLLYLVDAQRQYQQALMGYASARGDQFRDSAELLVSMGGGWWDHGAPQSSPTSADRGAGDGGGPKETPATR